MPVITDITGNKIYVKRYKSPSLFWEKRLFFKKIHSPISLALM